MLEKIIEKRKEYNKLWKSEQNSGIAMFYKGYMCALNWVEELFEVEE